jgi:predicted nucleic acid-binding protein
MVTYILDSSAILRYLDKEAGAARVTAIIKSHLRGECQVTICAPHWGEIAGRICKRQGTDGMNLVLSELQAFGIPVASLSGDQAVSAAMIKLRRQIPYVDPFGVALAAESPDRVLVTADFDLKPTQRDVKIEFLPTK